MPRPRHRLLGLLWGLGWRYALLAGVFLTANARSARPWEILAGVLLVGLALGLWHGRSVISRVWRTVAIAGGAVYIAPLTPVYADVVAGSISALTVGPLLRTLRRRR